MPSSTHPCKASRSWPPMLPLVILRDSHQTRFFRTAEDSFFCLRERITLPHVRAFEGCWPRVTTASRAHNFALRSSFTMAGTTSSGTRAASPGGATGIRAAGAPAMPAAGSSAAPSAGVLAAPAARAASSGSRAARSRAAWSSGATVICAAGAPAAPAAGAPAAPPTGSPAAWYRVAGTGGRR